MSKETIKRYLISSAVTFVTGFALVLATNIDNITIDTIKDGSFTGIVFLAVRAGIKAVLELFLSAYASK